MAFREVTVVQIKEVLRRWLRGEGERTIAKGVGVDRKTARRYIAGGIGLGVERSGGEEQLTEELIGQVIEAGAPASNRRARSRRGGCLSARRSRSRSGWLTASPS